MHELGQARSGNGEVVRALVSHCCGSGSTHGLVVTFGLSLLWVLVLALALFLHILGCCCLHKN